MIERLQRALKRIEGLPESMQDKVAELLEQFTASNPVPAGSLAASTPDLPDDTGQPLLRWQHESIPTLPLDEHLAWLDMGPDE